MNRVFLSWPRHACMIALQEPHRSVLFHVLPLGCASGVPLLLLHQVGQVTCAMLCLPGCLCIWLGCSTMNAMCSVRCRLGAHTPHTTHRHHAGWCLALGGVAGQPECEPLQPSIDRPQGRHSRPDCLLMPPVLPGVCVCARVCVCPQRKLCAQFHHHRPSSLVRLLERQECQRAFLGGAPVVEPGIAPPLHGLNCMCDCAASARSRTCSAITHTIGFKSLYPGFETCFAPSANDFEKGEACYCLE